MFSVEIEIIRNMEFLSSSSLLTFISKVIGNQTGSHYIEHHVILSIGQMFSEYWVKC